MNDSRPPCPSLGAHSLGEETSPGSHRYCGHTHVVKNGSTHHKKQKYRCKKCLKQFVEKRVKKYISLSTKEMVKKLLLARISWSGIARVLDISLTWLQKFVNNFYRQIPCQVKISGEVKDNLVLEIKEHLVWSEKLSLFPNLMPIMKEQFYI
jgi:transposase-like protein